MLENDSRPVFSVSCRGEFNYLQNFETKSMHISVDGIDQSDNFILVDMVLHMVTKFPSFVVFVFVICLNK